MFGSIDKDWNLRKLVKPPGELPFWILLYCFSVKTDNYKFLKMKE